eukprot:Gregarina_sp_Pseudo_9__5183@NODE_560_length_2579_cov_11_888976_g529_i0_p2_GENE_NODE_560_length_2579_cov_11_888976_g529_i0NODE_560_length_2579_cov_11_888976_g529_i0_p2_ORF_typecomplete_len425_score78_92DUF4795/PF16043_5/1_6e03DUF4795/PF16043_5/0_077Dynein_AAA_lid/PF17852_1/0_17FlxA/PF14282_6/3_1e02FlxA/PF14282_6/0_13FlxA/PF14282_6/3e03ZapB/PF06005_12/0_32DUF1192/PF06698_11/0_6Cep57_CLD_2/PF14197_6/0_51BLOC1_2/PF10046_9/4_5e02BLOC1_2/PF10046_9/1_4DivIC/PF04977_15/3_6e03DivIC/PF04977_15/0_17KIAA132
MMKAPPPSVKRFELDGDTSPPSQLTLPTNFVQDPSRTPTKAPEYLSPPSLTFRSKQTKTVYPTSQSVALCLQQFLEQLQSIWKYVAKINQREPDSKKVAELIKTFVISADFEEVLTDWLDIFVPSTWSNLKSDILTLCAFEDEFCLAVPGDEQSSEGGFRRRLAPCLTPAASRSCSPAAVAESYPMQWVELLFSALGMRNPLVELMIMTRKIIISMGREHERTVAKLKTKNEQYLSHIEDLEAEIRRLSQMNAEKRKSSSRECAFVQSGEQYSTGGEEEKWNEVGRSLTWNKTVELVEFTGEEGGGSSASSICPVLDISTTDTGDAATQTESLESIVGTTLLPPGRPLLLVRNVYSPAVRSQPSWTKVIGFGLLLLSLYFTARALMPFIMWCWKSPVRMQAKELNVGFWQSIVDQFIIYLLTRE